MLFFSSEIKCAVKRRKRNKIYVVFTLYDITNYNIISEYILHQIYIYNVEMSNNERKFDSITDMYFMDGSADRSGRFKLDMDAAGEYTLT